jgi:Periplasmic copper-binding protein (NosD)
MKTRLRGPALIMALAVVSMVAGFLAITAPAASAVTNKWYVATTGTNLGNSCASATHPCKTITYALAEQAAADVGGTINVAAGTYQEQVSITPANDNVKIKGAGTTTVIEAPTSGLLSDTDTDSSQPQYYVIDVAPGATASLTKLSVNGLPASQPSGSSFFDTDGYGCGQDYVGIYYHEASGSISKVSVSGIDMPADLYGCQGGLGIYVNSDEANPATVSMNKISELSPTTSITTRADLPAGTYSNDQLAVHTIPAGYSSGPIIVNGYNLNASKDTNKVLFITGTTDTDSPTGSVVSFEPYTPAYDKNGITCDDAYTDCTITGSTIQGEGPTNSIGQNGIQVFAAGSATISGNTISDNSYSGGGAGNSASGILILNSDLVNVESNTVSDNDANIYAGEVAAYGLEANSTGAWDIGGNTLSGATATGDSKGQSGYGEGIQLDSTSQVGSVLVEGNTITTSAQAGLLFTGASNADIGAVGVGATGNTIEGNEAGIVLAGPGTACETQPNCEPGAPGWTSGDNDFVNNTVTSNEAGVVAEGTYVPSSLASFGLSPDPDAALGNNFSDNSWSGNLLANAIDFSGTGDPSDQPAPIQNEWGSTDPNPSSNTNDSCDPTPGGSNSVNGLSGDDYVPAC